MEKLATEREVATRKYKINKIFLSFLCLFVAKFPSSAIAQDSPYIIATNFSATGKVLELDMPLEVDICIGSNCPDACGRECFHP